MDLVNAVEAANQAVDVLVHGLQIASPANVMYRTVCRDIVK